MNDFTNACQNLNTAIVISDCDFNITHVNQRAYEVFDMLEIKGLEVGRNMTECHKPETVEKLKGIYKAFAEKKIKVHYYTSEGPEGTLTIVAVPFYNGDDMGGVVEFIFEGGLG
ncbi:MAG: PAS domain-containing protein [Deltaproteobacteria bacterium]|jgi:sensor histidine kinase regulating citrate/malate metabolism|nr:PAS domain-containing protein [Deltaproteobacteria bacterium]MBW2476073.1 PAS domain-containing protein [Deltaproteobacteria bacterium]MBW2503306.1 PAS domain-containing protein [Deltaproteobacteria bacterium]MBW2519725.1 PAS domain-containing protein [Deltaproteobacteria bacterium]